MSLSEALTSDDALSDSARALLSRSEAAGLDLVGTVTVAEEEDDHYEGGDTDSEGDDGVLEEPNNYEACDEDDMEEEDMYEPMEYGQDDNEEEEEDIYDDVDALGNTSKYTDLKSTKIRVHYMVRCNPA